MEKLKMKKIILEVLGLSYSQTQAGAYALILTVKGTDNRIPIIIGSFEAQSIAIQLEEIITARPLTHDLFLSVCTRYEIEMKEVLIYKLEEGVFFSRLVLEKDGKTELIESRTSD
ncbi:MAG: bifunctional nuclease family protein, partial [Bacteroidales bacterium]|nr:bifunctional nuclease family protein [Bacteroidales bacterium]